MDEKEKEKVMSEEKTKEELKLEKEFEAAHKEASERINKPSPITVKMIRIADRPSNPWLEKYLKALGYVSFKFGDAPLKPSNKATVKAGKLVDIGTEPSDFDAEDTFVKHLASKLKVN